MNNGTCLAIVKCAVLILAISLVHRFALVACSKYVIAESMSALDGPLSPIGKTAVYSAGILGLPFKGNIIAFPGLKVKGGFTNKRLVTLHSLSWGVSGWWLAYISQALWFRLDENSIQIRRQLRNIVAVLSLFLIGAWIGLAALSQQNLNSSRSESPILDSYQFVNINIVARS